MPVIELALLHTKANPPNAHLPAPLKANLKHALSVLTKATSTQHPFTLLREEPLPSNPDNNSPPLPEYDPCNLYILGSWASIAEHEAFLPSDANRALLEMLKGELDVCWMFHFDGVAFAPAVAASSTSGGGNVDVARDLTGLVRESAVVVLERYVVSSERREEFLEKWMGVWRARDARYGRACVAGWRVGKVYGVEEEKEWSAEEEFVALSGWESGEQYAEFAATKAYDEEGDLRQLVEKADRRLLSVEATLEDGE